MVCAYLADVVAIFWVYVWVLKSVLNQPLEDTATITLLLLFPVLICVALVFGRPVLSDDLWAYMSSGYFSNLPGGNTYLHRAGDIANFPIAREFASYGVVPTTGITPYGPLWSCFELLVMRVAPNLRIALILFKCGISSAIFGSAFLVWDTCRMLCPSRRHLGVFAFLWNPLILVEIASEGHNDIWMVFFILLTLNLAVRQKTVGSLLSLWLGVLCKYIPVIFLPPLAVYLWRCRRHDWKFLAGVLGAGLSCLVLALALYHPFWIGAQTFQGVFGMRDRSQVTIAYWIERVLGSVLTEPFPARISTLIVDGGFFAFVLWCSFRVRTAVDLARAYLSVSLSYLFINSKRFWPWYPDVSISLISVEGGGLSNFLLLFLPFITRCVAPVSPLRNTGWITTRQGGYFYCAVGVFLPSIVLLALIVKRHVVELASDSSQA